jgi:hypothetical protein
MIEINQYLEHCHCGERVHVYADGFTRHLCWLCSTVRCDAPTEDGVYECSRRSPITVEQE